MAFKRIYRLQLFAILMMVCCSGLHATENHLFYDHYNYREMKPCDMLACQNGGSCDWNGYDSRWCKCPADWYGHRCEIESNTDTVYGLGSKGKVSPRDFIFAFPENYKQEVGPKVLIISHENSTQVDISLQGISFNRTVMMNAFEKQIIQLPLKAMSKHTGYQNVAVWIRSSGDISVYAINDNHVASGDAFLVHPTDALGTTYYVFGAKARKREASRSEIVIVGIEDNTTVSLYLNQMVNVSKVNYIHQQYLTVNRFEVIQFQSLYDLTGSSIESDKPLSVISGSRCGFVNSEKVFIKRSCEHMAVHLTPVDYGGRRQQFIVHPMHESGGETIVRIQSPFNTGVFVIGGANHNLPDTLHFRSVKSYEFREFKLTGYTPVYLDSFKPVQVVSYVSNLARECHDNPKRKCNSDGKSGISMVIAQPMTEYTSDAIFATFEETGGNNARDYALNVATRCKDRGGMTLNGHPLPSGNAWRRSADVCHLQIIIDEFGEGDHGVFRLKSGIPRSKFTASLVRNRPGSSIIVPASKVYHEETVDKDVAGQDVDTPHSGTEFIFGFINSCNCWTVDGPRLIIISDRNVDKTTVNVWALNGEFQKTLVLSPTSSVSVDLPARAIAVDAYDPKPPAAILVTASHPVTLYGMNDAYHDRSDGFLVRPTESLGTEYVLVSSWGDPYGAYTETAGQYLIIGIHANTIVDIEGRRTIKMDRLSTHQEKNNGGVIGFRVRSTKPVSVISGIECGYSQSIQLQPSGFGQYFWPCDHMVEHLQPISDWGHRYVVTRFEGYGGGGKTLIYFFSGLDSTMAYAPQRTDIVFSWLSSNYFFFDNTTANSSMIKANRPIQVVAMSGYGPLDSCTESNASSDCASTANAKPVMTLIPPLQPLVGRAKFKFLDIRGASDLRNYAYVATQCRAGEGIFVNDGSILDTWRKESVPDSEYCVFRFELERDTYYELWTTDGSIELSAIQYGFSSRSGFAFPIM